MRDATIDQRPAHLTLEPCAVKRRILAARMQLRGIKNKGGIHIENNQIGRRTDLHPPRLEPKKRRRAARQRPPARRARP